MLRVIASTGGIILEVVAFDAAAPTGTALIGVVGLAVGIVIWWREVGELIDRFVGMEA